MNEPLIAVRRDLADFVPCGPNPGYARTHLLDQPGAGDPYYYTLTPPVIPQGERR